MSEVGGQALASDLQTTGDAVPQGDTVNNGRPISEGESPVTKIAKKKKKKKKIKTEPNTLAAIYSVEYSKLQARQSVSDLFRLP